jgi:hypothetical protein
MWVLLLGWVALFFGGLLVFNPNGLVKMNEGLRDSTGCLKKDLNIRKIDS